ncbi:MAG TPA: FUSC family membrane protein [Chitinophagaceae bacterium]|nr:FUSC family membrane protein [Chitinophagaceae bacterium]
MNKKASLRLFFYGQSFTDGLRTTAALLLPALLLSRFYHFEIGLSASLGAACVSLTDAPGPIINRRNTMLFCIVFLFGVAVTTGLAQTSLLLMGLEIAIFSFFFSMFTVYGPRAMAVANASLLVMVLTMDKPLRGNEVIIHSLLVVSGGLMYLGISLLANAIRPYRPAQRVLGDSIRELSEYLFIKGEFYNTKTDLEQDYKKLLAQQAVVAEKQNEAREILFKTRRIVDESTPEGKRLVRAFVLSVDLLEDISATYYDYRLIRDKYAHSGILEEIHILAKELATILDKIGIAVLTNRKYKQQKDFGPQVVLIKKRIDAFQAEDPGNSHLILRKMLVNLRRIIERVEDLSTYLNRTVPKVIANKADTHTLFVAHQSLDPKLVWSNLHLSSGIFRHAMRVAIACIIGFVVAKLIAKGYHSYWILMTIIFMLKPSFSLTRQRNIERIAGTLIGGCAGFIILKIELPTNVLFCLMVLLMIGTYSLQRIKYFVSVICMTPFILILFHLLGVSFVGLLQERIIDTFVGCFIALLAGYLLFPDWESEQLKTYLYESLKANSNYLEKILTRLKGDNINVTDYKLARKEVFVQSANLSTAYDRMLSEPVSKQRNKKEIQQFIFTNHTLSSNIATMASKVLRQDPKIYAPQILDIANNSLVELHESLLLLDPQKAIENNIMIASSEENGNDGDELLAEQLDYILKLTREIKEITKKINAG